ncbi:hypothetical protein BH11PSE8_BH11PSE8_00750 [soil metagenome]
MINSKFAAVAALTACALAFGSNAQADTLQVQEFGTFATVGTNPGVDQVGVFTLTNSGNANVLLNGSFAAVCIEPTQVISQNARIGGDSTYAASFTAAPSASVQKLFDLYYNSAKTNDSDAAPFALALQELLLETSGSYSLATGAYQRTGFSSADMQAVAGAETLLSGLASAADATTHLQLVTFASGSSQDFIGAVTPVPEPETYALLLAGLGVIGFSVRRRRS